MERWPAFTIFSHFSYRLTFFHNCPLLHQQLAIVTISTEIVLIMFDYDKPTIPYQTTPCIDHLPTFRSNHLLAAAAADFYPFATWVDVGEALLQFSDGRPLPNKSCTFLETLIDGRRLCGAGRLSRRLFGYRLRWWL